MSIGRLPNPALQRRDTAQGFGPPVRASQPFWPGGYMDARSPIREKDANALGRGCLFPLLGGALLLGAALGCLDSAVRWWGAERTEGTVVALEGQPDDGGV